MKTVLSIDTCADFLLAARISSGYLAWFNLISGLGLQLAFFFFLAEIQYKYDFRS